MEQHGCSSVSMKAAGEYYSLVEREMSGSEEHKFLDGAVPPNIKSDLMLHLAESLIPSCDFLKDCDESFLRKVASELEQRFFPERSHIILPGTCSGGMYWVKKGKVELVKSNESGSSSSMVEVGECFADRSLLDYCRLSPFAANAETDCELWFLHRRSFDVLVTSHPSVKDSLAKFIKIGGESFAEKTSRIVRKVAVNAKRRHALYLSPDSLLLQVWFFIVLCVSLYILLIIPFRIAFLERHTISSWWYILDYCADTVLIIDIVIQAWFLAYYEDNHLFVQNGEIFENYRRSGMLKWHVLSLLPLEVLCLRYGSLCPLGKLQTWSLFRLNKLIRGFDIPRLFASAETAMARAGFKVPKNPLRILKLLILIMLTAHIVGSIFFAIAVFDQYNKRENPELQSNWANNQGLLDISPACSGIPTGAETFLERYIAALYWAVATLTTVGYGDITAAENSISEKLFSTIILVVGTAIYTLVIAMLEDIVSQLDVTSLLYTQQLEKVTTYLNSHGSSEQLKSKIHAYYSRIWHTQKGVKAAKVMEYLPPVLRRDVVHSMTRSVIDQCFFFKDCSSDFIASTVEKLRLEVYMPEERLYHQGQRCESLIFLTSGEVDFLTESGIKFKTVSDCCLGDHSFFGYQPYVCTAQASTICEAFHLDWTVSTNVAHKKRILRESFLLIYCCLYSVSHRC
jgi:CRP-like cAMP-binding protein